MSENDKNRFGESSDQNFGARGTSQDPVGKTWDDRNEAQRGPLDQAANAGVERGASNREALASARGGTGGMAGASDVAGTRQGIVSAVFDSQAEAQRAVTELRNAGVSDHSLSIIAQHEGKTTTTSGDGEITDNDHRNILRGILGGGALGAGLGIAALAIPGVGPLAAAGAIAASAVPEAAALGAVAGALGGSLNELLTKHGVSEEDASYYGDRIKSGGVFVSVDMDAAGTSPDIARDILYRSGGHSSSRARMS